ncbi:hypothetical protein GOBAR_AA06650 [Gossypium barbadense]|uniref:Uncharacterized protein n=1 Tax=Gossypium barbadense TaxID=3634 RepID=A0A2P5YE96_GOSBA|nr:hypothetical protein GOBAR_AA06650 [Gossypium barbadense]
MTNYDDPSTVQFRLGGLVCQLSVLEFRTALGLYTEEFMEENNLDTLNRHIHHSPSRSWDALVPGGATYNPSHSKASALPPSLRYLHTILAHTITGRRENTGVVNTHDAYFLWCMSHGYIIDLAYFIALATQHHTERHRKGLISIGPYHEDPPTQPPPPSRPVHAAASYADISECLTRSSSNVFNDLTTLMLLYSRFLYRALKLIIAQKLNTPPGKVLHDYHVLIDHDHSYH